MPNNAQFMGDLFRSLRPMIMTSYGKVDHIVKANSTPVTEIDTALETHMKNLLLEQFPGIGFHGEEHGRSGSTETYWLIDPLDGTENYIRGRPIS